MKPPFLRFELYISYLQEFTICSRFEENYKTKIEPEEIISFFIDELF